MQSAIPSKTPPRGETETAPIRTVLVALDPLDAERNRAVWEAAMEVAALHEAGLRFLYAVAPVHFPNAGTEGMAQREALRQMTPRLDALSERATEGGLRADWSARVGGVEDAIGAEAEAGAADLVVLAAPRRWLPGRWLRRLHRRVGVPILCVPPSTERQPDLSGTRRVLVPSFRREGALRAVAAAIRVLLPSRKARRAGRVLLLRPHGEPGASMPRVPSASEALDRDTEEGRMKRMAGDLGALGIEADVLMGRAGEPAEAVTRQARDAGADVIAIDARARDRRRLLGWLRRGLLGRLLGRASRPLLVS